MNIDNYISDLLYLHDCVIVPGFGGFVGNYRSAEVRDAQLTFLPPSKAIVFNKNLVSNDGLLTNYIAEVEGINFVEAKLKIERFVKDCLKKLEKGDILHFEGIGAFVFDKQRLLQFEPESGINYLMESFGLSSFRFKAIDESGDITFEKHFADKESVRPKVKYKTARRILIGSAIALALSLVPLKTNRISDYKIDAASFNPVKTETVKKEFNKTSGSANVEKTIDSLTDKKVAMAPSTTETPKPTGSEVKTEKTSQVQTIKETPKPVVAEKKEIEKVTKSSNYKFFIIAGSFREESNAKAFCGQLSDKGLNCEILYKEKGLYKVSVGAFTDNRSAVSELQKIRTNNKDVAVWILSK